MSTSRVECAPTEGLQSLPETAVGVQAEAVLTEDGREFCGRAETHAYELLLALEDIEHRGTKVRSPRTNGFVERMNRTLLDECFRIHGRTTWYERVNEIQSDLDRFLIHYNLRRSHQGYRVVDQGYRVVDQGEVARAKPDRLVGALGSHRACRHDVKPQVAGQRREREAPWRGGGFGSFFFVPLRTGCRPAKETSFGVR